MSKKNGHKEKCRRRAAESLDEDTGDTVPNQKATCNGMIP